MELEPQHVIDQLVFRSIQMIKPDLTVVPGLVPGIHGSLPGEGRDLLHPWAPAFEAVRKLDIRLKVFCFVVPAKAGTQGFQSLALGPRFRGGDELRGLRD